VLRDCGNKTDEFRYRVANLGVRQMQGRHRWQVCDPDSSIYRSGANDHPWVKGQGSQ
jgi:hypothetical protein